MQVDTTFANATVQGNVYAQPLYLAGTAGKPDEVIVATEQNRVQAFNAASGASLWTMSMGTPVTTGLPCGNIATTGGLGVTGTPVIDGPNRIIYLDAMTLPNGGMPTHMLHALNADTGAEQLGWPVNVDQQATQASGGTQFVSMYQNQRAALALVNGTVYVPYGGHYGDCGTFHGWIVGVTAKTNPTVTAWATRATAGGGVWGASGIASDGTSLFFATGNATMSAAPSTWGDSQTVYKFPGTLVAPPMTTTTDYFVPSNWSQLDSSAQDIGGTGPVLVNVPGATPSALVMALGTDKNAYLLDRSNMGGLNATPLAQATVSTGQIINAFTTYTTSMGTYVVFKGTGSGCPTGGAGGLTALKISATNPPTITTAWCGGPATAYSPAVSQTDTNGSNTVVWVVGSGNQLYALDGDTGTALLNAVAIGGTVQSIQTPIIANGRIFVATNSKVVALKPTTLAP
jgi:outer membrane protein assembly factor BamB